MNTTLNIITNILASIFPWASTSQGKYIISDRVNFLLIKTPASSSWKSITVKHNTPSKKTPFEVTFTSSSPQTDIIGGISNLITKILKNPPPEWETPSFTCWFHPKIPCDIITVSPSGKTYRKVQPLPKNKETIGLNYVYRWTPISKWEPIANFQQHNFLPVTPNDATILGLPISITEQVKLDFFPTVNITPLDQTPITIQTFLKISEEIAQIQHAFLHPSSHTSISLDGTIITHFKPYNKPPFSIIVGKASDHKALTTLKNLKNEIWNQYPHNKPKNGGIRFDTKQYHCYVQLQDGTIIWQDIPFPLNKPQEHKG